MSPASNLSVLDLWKGYARGQPVLRGVNLSVSAGSVGAVLGLSGCGKTTLLRAIAGFERIQRGQIGLGARTLDDGHAYVPPENRGIGYVPQEGALFPNLSVQANVAFGLSRAERRTKVVNELLEMVGLLPLAQRLPHQLSGGEQQRVALARALARRPELLLLDEPFSSLDASLRASMREEVGALLRGQGATTVLVTHDQEEALSLADSVAVLRDGAIVQQGTPEELYRRPIDARLATFLGAANLLPATFHDGCADTILGRLRLGLDQRPAASLIPGLVLVRPEQLRVTSDRESEGLPGTIEQCRYYGPHALLHIRPDGAPRAGTLIARVDGERALPAGTAVLVSASGPVSAVAGLGS